MHHNFNNSSDSQYYLPAPGYTQESSTLNYLRQWIAPYNGKFIKVIFYTENDAGNCRVTFIKNGIASGYVNQEIDATTATTISGSSMTGGFGSPTKTFS